MGATTPLVQGAGTASRYWAALLAHTFGAVLAGGVAGAVLGLIARLVPAGGPVGASTAVVAGAGVGLGLQEVGLLRVAVLQVSRQTSKQWREALGPVGAATAWGIDLGSGLTTYVVYAAYWVLPVAALVRGEVAYGATLLGTFGLARALSVIMASLAAREAARIPVIGAGTPFHRVLLRLSGYAPAFRRRHGWGTIAVCVAVLVHLAL